MKRISVFLTVLISIILLTVPEATAQELTYPVIQDTKFDSVFLDVSIEDFIASGFAFGDSCDVVFSNGLSFIDIPFYNGYYVRTAMPLIVGYPGYEYVTVARSNAGLWTYAGLKPGDTATVILRETGKYLNEQNTLSQTYSNNRSDYRDDVQFANFRALTAGNLKKDFLYRGASPVDDQKKRASTVDALLEKYGIRFILDLADSQNDLSGYRSTAGFSSFYSAGLYDRGNTALLDMGADYGSDAYKQKLSEGLRKMLSAEGPVFIHCLEGKDRTGFVCFLLESLAGADYGEMLEDYMKTYENYYGITKENSPEKYVAIASIYFDGFASFLHGTDDHEALIHADYSKDAELYLLEGGLTADEIASLHKMITRDSEESFSEKAASFGDAA